MFRKTPVPQIHAEQIDVDRRQRVRVMGPATPAAVHVTSVKGSRQRAGEPVTNSRSGHVQSTGDLGGREPFRSKLEASTDDAHRMSHGEHMFA